MGILQGMMVLVWCKLEGEVNLNYIRVTLSHFRRYHFLKNRLRALTWHHLCVTYNNDVTVSYLDGIEQDRHIPQLGEKITGNQIKIGAWDDNNSFSGQLSQASIWGEVSEYQFDLNTCMFNEPVSDCFNSISTFLTSK
ncbi:hypothetical protein Pmani_000087 [Petrolisthes manimaculis]|uniref:Uncharacterized protein n=1 Tax=Petrolisthes manimaculis TaxID=1843537 RepID=A0AAE1QMS0_9EUCA|nr:hypothetical protein Pmani_000087 [Petrolisthes manimaculis]